MSQRITVLLVFLWSLSVVLGETSPLCNRLKSTSVETKRLRSEIFHEWNVTNYPRFLIGAHLSPTAYDLYIKKMAYVLLNPSEFQENPFLVVFTGSSVTAGHDNAFEDSYSEKFFRNLHPTFDAMGANFSVVNSALGNNPCLPYDACMDVHASHYTDILSWEQSYNCGRSAGMIELMARATYTMERRPFVWVQNSGSFTFKSEACAKYNVIPDAFVDRHTPVDSSEKSLLENDFKTVVGTIVTDTVNGYARTSGFSNVKTHYDSAGYLSYSQESLGYPCLGPYNLKFLEKRTGGGASWHPGYGQHALRADQLAFFLASTIQQAAETLEQLICKPVEEVTSGKRVSNTAGQVKVMANPNIPSVIDPPVVVKHDDKNRLVEDYFTTIAKAFNLNAKLTDDMLNQILKSTDITKQSLLMESVSKALMNAQQAARVQEPIPEYKFGNEYPEFEKKPICYSDYRPGFKHLLSSRLFTNFNFSRPLVNVEPDGKYWDPTDFHTEPQPQHGGWVRAISFYDTAAMANTRIQERGYLDRKLFFTSTGMNTSIHFVVDMTTTGRPWLCEMHRGFSRYPKEYGLMHEATAFVIPFINKHPKLLVELKHDPLSHLKPESDVAVAAESIRIEVRKDHCYVPSIDLPPGRHLLTLIQSTPLFLNIGYVISF